MNPEEFKAIRRKLGLSLAGLASRLGVSEQQVRRYEAPAGKSMARPIPDAIAAKMRELERQHP